MSSLEVGLITVLAGLVVGVAVRLLTQSRFVSRGECQRMHQYDDQWKRQVTQQLTAQSRMIRALVLNSGMSPQDQQTILENCEVQVERNDG